MLTPEQQRSCLVGADITLRFLVESERRARKPAGMESFSDSACFHRLRDLTWAITSPEMVACLSAEQSAALAKFERVYHSLPWQVIATHLHISELPGDNLLPLVPAGERLLRLIAPPSIAAPSPNHALQRTAGARLSFFARLLSRHC